MSLTASRPSPVNTGDKVANYKTRLCRTYSQVRVETSWILTIEGRIYLVCQSARCISLYHAYRQTTTYMFYKFYHIRTKSDQSMNKCSQQATVAMRQRRPVPKVLRRAITTSDENTLGVDDSDRQTDIQTYIVIALSLLHTLWEFNNRQFRHCAWAETDFRFARILSSVHAIACMIFYRCLLISKQGFKLLIIQISFHVYKSMFVCIWEKTELTSTHARQTNFRFKKFSELSESRFEIDSFFYSIFTKVDTEIIRPYSLYKTEVDCRWCAWATSGAGDKRFSRYQRALNDVQHSRH